MSDVEIYQYGVTDYLHHVVKIKKVIVGCIFMNTNDKFVFHPYATFQQLDSYGKQLVTAAAEERALLLNITERLRG